MSLAGFIEERPKLREAKEIVFFGGSFNPWHAGHKACVDLLPEDKALVALPDHNPYKELTEPNEEAVSEIMDALSKRKGPSFVFEDFLKAGKKNPTHSWIRELKDIFPDKQLSLLVGFDSFIGIDKWIQAKDLLLDLSAIYVASRMDDPSTKEKQKKHLRAINPNLRIVFLGSHPYESLSSTILRKNKDGLDK